MTSNSIEIINTLIQSFAVLHPQTFTYKLSPEASEGVKGAITDVASEFIG